MTRIVSLLLALGLMSMTIACSTPGLVRQVEGMRVLSAKPAGTQLYFLEESPSPVLIVKSPRGIGQARLQLPVSLSQGMTIEFPGLQNLEKLVLHQGQRHLVCSGGREEVIACSWGEEWPVGQVRRYPTGMTVTLPASMFTQSGKWTLEWVDQWRH